MGAMLQSLVAPYCCSECEPARGGNQKPEVLVASNDEDSDDFDPVEASAAPEYAGHFDVSLKKMGKPLGLDLELTSIGLLIRSVGCGVVRGHNVKVYPEEQVMKHDVILQVNKIAGNAVDMLYELKMQDSLDLCIAHPTHLHATIRREDNQVLGARVTAHDEESTVLEVIELKPRGAFKAYNDHAKKADRIHQSDYISGVNSVRGSAQSMVAELTQSLELNISLLRVTKPEEKRKSMLSSRSASSLEINSKGSSRATSPSSNNSLPFA